MFALLLQTEIQNLTSINFDNFILEKPTLLKFYSPYCSHCIRATSEIKKLAYGSELGFQIGQVDCSQNLYLCQEQLVSGYPTIVFISNGSRTLFEGKINSKSILKWVRDLLK
uniref:Thioredoxin domain-containing protein n=1 Tax=Spironucleus salmonicida TaxID=348837 RepID=V6M5V2_9EUKA|eukprot:EST48719.1 Thioredoxin domain-containing protein [Spironucleus salmonicida]